MSRSHTILAAIFFFVYAASSAVAQQRLSLHEAVRMGLAGAPEAHTSGDRLNIERAQVEQARLRPNPRLYLQSEDLRPWDHSFSFVDSTEDFGYLSQTVEMDGKRGKRIAYAQGGVRRGEAEHSFELRRIAAGIADAYWAAAAARASLAECQHTVAALDELVRYQAAGVQDGATAGVDLLRTQIERDRLVLSCAQAERQTAAANIELARRTVSPAAASATLTDALEQERPVTELAPAAALDQRPDILAAQEAVNQAHADLRLQHANAVPNLDILGGYKRNVGVNTAYGGLQLDLPLFSRNQGGIAVAQANQQLAEDQLAYARLSAGAEIETALSNYHREQELVQTALPGMGERAQQNATILRDAYRSGGADLLRYLDAERVLIETHLLAIDTWTEYQRSVVALQLAYGEDQ